MPQRRDRLPPPEDHLRWLSPIKRPKRGFGGTINDPEQRSGWPLGRALSLLPIAHGINRNADAIGERHLGQTDPASDPARVGGGVTHCLGFVFGDLSGDLSFGGCVDSGPVDLRLEHLLGPVG
jgi:hypothetical protein